MNERAVSSGRPEAGEEARWLTKALSGLVRRFSVSERADASCCGLTVAQAATLGALRDEGAMRLGGLGQRLGITPSTLTRNLARLENGGLVERDADGRDRRAFEVRLTASGRQAADRLQDQEQAFAEGLLRRLPPERRMRALEGLADLMEVLRAATEDCCPGAFDHLLGGASERPSCCSPEGDCEA